MTLAELRKLAKSRGYKGAAVAEYDAGATVARVDRGADGHRSRLPYMQALHPSRDVATRMLAMGLRGMRRVKA